MQKDSEKLKHIRYEYRLTQDELAQKLGVTKSYIGLVETGKSKLSAKMELKINGLFANTNQKNSNDEIVTIDDIGIHPSCGLGTIVTGTAEITPIKMSGSTLSDIFKASDIKNIKRFRASGDSMETTIFDQDLLLVDIGRKDYNNGGVFVITINNDWFIKRLRLKINGDLEIISDNTEKYQTEVKNRDDGITINIIGKVIKNLSRGL